MACEFSDNFKCKWHITYARVGSTQTDVFWFFFCRLNKQHECINLVWENVNEQFLDKLHCCYASQRKCKTMKFTRRKLPSDKFVWCLWSVKCAASTIEIIVCMFMPTARNAFPMNRNKHEFTWVQQEITGVLITSENCWFCNYKFYQAQTNAREICIASDAFTGIYSISFPFVFTSKS